MSPASQRALRPYGLWDSPISPGMLAGNLRLDGLDWDSDGETLVWLEGRDGTGTLVRSLPGGDAPRDLTIERNVRAGVGYGGGDFAASHGQVFFADFRDGRIYRQPLDGGEALPVTPDHGHAASPTLSPDGRFMAYVHHDAEGVDRIGIVDAAGRAWPQILVEGHDFYMQPRWSPDGRFFAWLAWDQPDMPWDATTLYLAPVILGADAGGRRVLPRLGEARAVAGGEGVAVFQPEFTPDGRGLLFVSDETGWGNLTRMDLETGERLRVTHAQAEHGMPAWAQDMRSYAVADGGRRIYVVRGERGFRRLYQVEPESGNVERVEALADYGDVQRVVAAPGRDRIALIASGSKHPPRVLVYDGGAQRARVIARASAESVAPEDLAEAEPISWATRGGETAHGLYFGPSSSRFLGHDRPPLVVMVHGGPTSQVTAAWNEKAQFLATRGYAVLEVNYRGSTGYGRAYMQRLQGNWGVLDMEDAVSGARHLAERGLADPERSVIMGGSAGGLTVLQAMIHEPEAFAAGIDLFGVADQMHLAQMTHKFEARYQDKLLGKLPESAQVYRDRSPVLHADKILRPLAVFQGADDRVVPREQSDAIVAALAARGIPHEYHVYEGEGHGWRKRETIEHFWGRVEAFLRQQVVMSSRGASNARAGASKAR